MKWHDSHNFHETVKQMNYYCNSFFLLAENGMTATVYSRSTCTIETKESIVWRPSATWHNSKCAHWPNVWFYTSVCKILHLLLQMVERKTRIFCVYTTLDKETIDWKILLYHKRKRAYLWHVMVALPSYDRLMNEKPLYIDVYT